MPVVRAKDKLFYFAHVPKCGGSSVDEYLLSRFGKENVGFLDSRFSAAQHVKSWNKTSPQHITYTHRQRIMPDTIFDFQFAVVRHPLRRMISMFHFNHRRLRGLNFQSWMQKLKKEQETNPYYLDNHPRLMLEIIPPQSKIFKLEDGLNDIPKWLDEQLGEKSVHNLNIGHANQGPKNDMTITDGDVEIVYNMYRKDYNHFGYERNVF